MSFFSFSLGASLSASKRSRIEASQSPHPAWARPLRNKALALLEQNVLPSPLSIVLRSITSNACPRGPAKSIKFHAKTCISPGALPMSDLVAELQRRNAGGTAARNAAPCCSEAANHPTDTEL